MATKTNTKTMKKIVAVLALACVAVASAAPNNATATCEAMAEKLNKRYMVGSNRFNTSATGQEARDELREWMTSNGILFSMCNPEGYPDVYGPCGDMFLGVDHIPASWVGLTDRARDLVEADTFDPFPVFAFGAVGLVFDPTFEQAQVYCSSPTDSASASRQPDEDGNPGCGPQTSNLLYGRDNHFRDVQAYLSGQVNASVEYDAANDLKEYYSMVSGWDQMNWKAGEDFASAPFNKTCAELFIPKTKIWSAVTPVDQTMEGCRAFISDPKNIVQKGKFGSMNVIGFSGTWDINSTVIQEALGHEICIDDEDAPCLADGTCAGVNLEWEGACTWKPEDFMSSIDAQHELGSRKIPGIEGPSAYQWNEVSMPLIANTPQGVEAIFHFGDYFDTWTANAQKQAEGQGTQVDAFAKPYPSDYGTFAKYAAHKLAEGYYGGVPVVTVTPTKENALAGKIFGCSSDI